MNKENRPSLLRWFGLGSGLALVTGLVLTIYTAFIHAMDVRVFLRDNAGVLRKSLALVDHGDFSYAGQHIYNAGYTIFHLGPLAHLLTAIPLFFSRDVAYTYYFNTYIVFPAGILFFLACRRLKMSLLATGISTSAFMAVWVATNIPVKPDNTSWLPFFLALYSYFLGPAITGKRRAIFGLWLALGLCMHLHIMAGLLVPATLIMLKPQKRRQWSVHAVGLLIVAILHVHLFFEFGQYLWRVAHHAGGDLPAFMPVLAPSAEEHTGRFWFLFRQSLVFPTFFLMPFLLFVMEVVLGRQKFFRFMQRSPIMHGALFFYFSAALVVPYLCLYKGGIYAHYYYIFIALFCLLVGLGFDAVFPHGLRAYVVVPLMTLLLVWQIYGAFFYSPPPEMFSRRSQEVRHFCRAIPGIVFRGQTQALIPRVLYSMKNSPDRLEPYITAASRLGQLLDEHGLREVYLNEHWRYIGDYRPARLEQGVHCRGGEVYLWTLLNYLRPDLQVRLPEPDMPEQAPMMLVTYTSKERYREKCISPSGSYMYDLVGYEDALVDRWQTEAIHVNVYLTTATRFLENDICQYCKYRALAGALDLTP